MAHYAFLDKNNIVTEVITGIDETELIEGLNTETWYGNFKGQVCKRTSYNTTGNTHKNNGTPFRGNYAGIGYLYDTEFDVFIPVKPFPSWKLNYEKFLWEAPISKPAEQEGFIWKWSEPNLVWIKVVSPASEGY
jgi:hypothetical protein